MLYSFQKALSQVIKQGWTQLHACLPVALLTQPAACPLGMHILDDTNFDRLHANFQWINFNFGSQNKN